MAYPIASMSDGTVLYSDGSRRSASASYADSPAVSNYSQPATSQPISSGGGVRPSKPFEQYMAESGRQSELDELGRSGGYAQAKAQYESGQFGGGTMDAGSFVNQAFQNAEKEISFLEQYTKEHPFSFDEELAKQSSTAEYEPYYSELLEDYLTDVGVKKDTIQDEQKLLSALRTTPEGTAGEYNRAYSRAVAQAEEGFAGSGMFFSGIKKRKLGEAEVEKEYDVRGMATGVQRKERDVGREQKTAIEGGVLQRQQEAMSQYYTPFVQSYQRQFPTGARDLTGYMPPEYLMYRA